jgi:hypothetical protein
MLHACHDTRSEGLKVYKIFEFTNHYYTDDDGTQSEAGYDGADWDWEDHSSGGPDLPEDGSLADAAGGKPKVLAPFQTYINYCLDTLYLNMINNLHIVCVHFLLLWWGNINEEGSTEIQHIAVSMDVLADERFGHHELAEQTLYNEYLQTITFVPNDPLPRASKEHCKTITSVEDEPPARGEISVEGARRLQAFKADAEFSLTNGKLYNPCCYEHRVLPNIELSLI